MVQSSSGSDHGVRAAQGWDGEVQTTLEKETQQRHINLGLLQGKLRSNLHKVRERERLLLLPQIVPRNIYFTVELCSQQCVTKMSGTIRAKPQQPASPGCCTAKAQDCIYLVWPLLKQQITPSSGNSQVLQGKGCNLVQ